MFFRLALVTRLGRGNGKVGCAITGGIIFWGCYWKGTLSTRLLTTGGFKVVLSRKLAKISEKGWRPLVSTGFAIEDNSVGKIGLASSKGNLAFSSSSIYLFKLIDSCGGNLQYPSHCLHLQCMQLNSSHWWRNF